MGKKREQPHDDPTSIALLTAVLGGVGVLFYGESLLHDLQDPRPHAQVLTEWRVHMGAACMGAAGLVVILYLLELLGRQSKSIAWRSSWPWLPLVGFTAIATVIHIPAYAVVSACAIYSVWASRRTYSVR
jgi:hypothetical protein